MVIGVVFITTALIAAYNIYHSFQNISVNQAAIFEIMMWNLILVFSLAMCIYVAHVKIYQSRKKRWLGIIRQFNKDSLTGLPNQQRLLRDLEQSQHTNLAFIKFHNYNSILNSYGPAVTDDVVRQLATVISQFEHPMLVKSNYYYIQPGVFAILEDQDAEYERIENITKALVIKIVTAQYKVGDGQYVSLNVTVGAVRQNQDAYMLANMALQEAEAKKLQFYLIDQQHSSLPETYKRELALTQTLLQGIKDRRIVAYFQPIFAAKDKSLQKYECLSRLVDDQGEIVLMPNVFMPLAHRANVYYLISQIMIKHAVNFAQQHEVVVSVNLSISDINNKRTCEYLFNKVKRSGVAHLIQFELLENEAIIEPDFIIEIIEKLHELGCQVGMDDLGKGYSNIERLINLPIDFVKIDRTIMENVLLNLEMQNLAKGIVELAHKKNLEVVAEYCSDAELTTMAVDLGVDYLQGFYLGKPKPTVVQ
jgi:EAL domain-containing protein (putative c-di-GMP-specific phosphodiesterase class I)/GGDEF domain-containing protein